VFLVARAGTGQLRLLGELDIAGVPAVRAELAGSDGDVEIDCSGLTFIACSGLKVLVDAYRTCQAQGVRLSLIAPSACVIRLLDLTELNGFFDIRQGPRL
jgi:anti-anti-sigma factor